MGASRYGNGPANPGGIGEPPEGSSSNVQGWRQGLAASQELHHEQTLQETGLASWQIHGYEDVRE